MYFIVAVIDNELYILDTAITQYGADKKLKEYIKEGTQNGYEDVFIAVPQ